MRFIALACSALIIGLDQLFKYLAIVNLSEKILTLPIIPDVFHLTYLENRGAAFGILDGKTFFLVFLTGLVILGLIVIVAMGKFKSPFMLWSVALIIGGGLGNLIDRIFRGYVVDYLDFRIINFAVFNFADCCVVVGTVLVFIYVIFLERKNMAKKLDTDVLKTKNSEANEQEHE